MVLQTTGARFLALMMRTERARTIGPDTAWLLFGPTDGEAVTDSDPDSDPGAGDEPAAAWRMAAE